MEAEEHTAASAAEESGEPEFTVDELAARVGITVRNVRAYAARGLLPPPRLVGRTGYYGPEHVSRLLLVREMLAEGYSLAVIERTLATAPAIGGSASLALHRALLAPWLPPEPEETTIEELAARAGVPVDPATFQEMERLGLVEQLGDGRLRVTDPSLLTAGLQVVQLGVPPSALITAQARVIELVREVAATYVGMFVETGWRSVVEAGSPPAQLDRVQTMMARLQPAAAQALLASFRTEMAAAVGAAVEAELRALSGD